MERSERKIAAAALTQQILVRPEAEVQQSFDWYEEQTKGLGLEFLRTIEARLSDVTRNPSAYPVVKVMNVRRAVFRRFPFK